MDRLEEILNAQYLLQRHINGYDIEDQTTAQRIENIKLNVLAATAELHECLAEMSWKPWAKGEPRINHSAAAVEVIDAFHFMLNIMLHLGMTSDTIYDVYMNKNQVNHRRQDEGYDGVSSKCRRCQRDLEDGNLNEVIVQNSFPRVDLHCVCGAYLGSRAV